MEKTTRSDLELSLYFTDNEEIKELNAKYRNKNYPTDVLSFPQEYPLLGDIVISVDKLKEQANEKKHSFEEELYFLIIHGTLHLFGYDHEKGAREEARMNRLQKKIFKKFMEEISD